MCIIITTAETEASFVIQEASKHTPTRLGERSSCIPQKSVLWHARKICAISASNTHQYVSSVEYPCNISSFAD